MRSVIRSEYYHLGISVKNCIKGNVVDMPCFIILWPCRTCAKKYMFGMASVVEKLFEHNSVNQSFPQNLVVF